jgi:hypothetical protein
VRVPIVKDGRPPTPHTPRPSRGAQRSSSDRRGDSATGLRRPGLRATRRRTRYGRAGSRCSLDRGALGSPTPRTLTGAATALFLAFGDRDGRHRARSLRDPVGAETCSAHGAWLPTRERVSFVGARNQPLSRVAVREERIRHMPTVRRRAERRCSLVDTATRRCCPRGPLQSVTTRRGRPCAVRHSEDAWTFGTLDRSRDSPGGNPK